jgi:hypothetical protein
MASGYEKSPEYGGPEPKWTGIFWTFVALVILSVAVTYLRAHFG